MKSFIKLTLCLGLLLVFLLPGVVFGQTPPRVVTPDGGAGSNDTKSPLFQLVTCEGIDDPRTDEKEIECTYNHLIYTFTRIMKFVLYLLTPIILGMVLYTGFLFVTAGGDAGKLSSAKKMIWPLILGVFFIFAAYLIVYKLILGNLLDDSGGIDKVNIINAGGNQ